MPGEVLDRGGVPKKEVPLVPAVPCYSLMDGKDPVGGPGNGAAFSEREERNFTEVWTKLQSSEEESETGKKKELSHLAFSEKGCRHMGHRAGHQYRGSTNFREFLILVIKVGLKAHRESHNV
ncbi:hypothetical protein HPG69_007414 [Diceros bicornis minor]|uniref:Uncharacterized protein n=1 Tax=Diceros bicornis minor TaxID=77932 RepID=A0A7J7F915_DICBM|nr:hypothetical protein HPG69_007414 [Diceros bicornis minor]